MEGSSGIVAGGCTNPGDLSANRRRPSRSLRQQLNGVERVLGAPVKIERYKLADDQIVEFRFYQNAGTGTGRPPSLWRRMLRPAERQAQTPTPRVVAIRNDASIALDGDALYQQGVMRAESVLVSSGSAAPSNHDNIKRIR